MGNGKKFCDNYIFFFRKRWKDIDIFMLSWSDSKFNFVFLEKKDVNFWIRYICGEKINY